MKGQHTYESCLAWCLLHLAGEKPTLEKELEILDFSLRFTKKDFTIGHLEAVHEQFEKIALYIYYGFRYDCNSVAQLRKSKNIHISPCDTLFMTPILLTEVKEVYPLIVYLDAYVLWGHHHYPHYVIALDYTEEGYEILDPWDGKKRIIPEKVLMEGVVMLRDYLGFAPRVIRCVPKEVRDDKRNP